MQTQGRGGAKNRACAVNSISSVSISMEGASQLTGRAKRLCAGMMELVRRYEELIVRDPELAGRLEYGIRLASYLVPGRIGGSWAATEAAYSLANLYCLLNDYIVTKKCPSASPLNRVRDVLTVHAHLTLMCSIYM